MTDRQPDRQADQPTDQQTDTPGHRKVTLLKSEGVFRARQELAVKTVFAIFICIISAQQITILTFWRLTSSVYLRENI